MSRVGSVVGGAVVTVLGVVMVANFATKTLGVRFDDLNAETRGLCAAATRVATQVKDSADGEPATAMRLMADGAGQLTTALGAAPTADADVRSQVSKMADAMSAAGSAIMFRDKARFDSSATAAEAATDELRSKCG